MQYSPAYVINNIKFNAARKKLVFNLFYTKKIFNFLIFFKYLGIIRKFILIKNQFNKKWSFKVYIFFFKNYKLYKNFKIVSSPSRSVFISHHSLFLLQSRTRDSIFIIETTEGLLTHTDAIKRKKGGKVWGFVSF